MKNLSTTIICLTLNAENTIEKILQKIDFNKYQFLIIDSESYDDTIRICKKYDCKIDIINKKDFNHGATREYARKLIKSDIVVFLTQDAIPSNFESIDNLIKPIIDGKVSVSYGKQVPYQGSSTLESFPREFNYGNKYQIRSINDIKKYGVYTFFCSDSFSAYLNNDLDLIGGIETALVSEDFFTVAKLLKNGKKIAYVPQAQVFHSHKYSLIQEFSRMFDTGYVRAERPWINNYIGSATNRGIEFSIQLIKKLILESPALIPYALLNSLMKYIGYTIGLNGLRFPKRIKKKFSGQKYFWDSKYYNIK